MQQDLSAVPSQHARLALERRFRTLFLSLAVQDFHYSALLTQCANGNSKVQHKWHAKQAKERSDKSAPPGREPNKKKEGKRILDNYVGQRWNNLNPKYEDRQQKCGVAGAVRVRRGMKDVEMELCA